MSLNNMSVAVVIPCFKVKKHILNVIKEMPEYVDRIYIIDDRCPEKSGQHVQENCNDSRIWVYRNPINLGVGGAVCQGYKMALAEEMDIVVKVDGDGQMDPCLIRSLIDPILNGIADYTKGSRFFHPEGLSEMPLIRLLGNAGLSFINKVVTGYWDIMDPTNGFTAISNEALKNIPLEKLSSRYFFESDILFRLSLAKARVVDFSMKAKYGDEVSNLKIHNVLCTFPFKYLKRFMKRLVYQYFLRDFNYGSLSLISGLSLLSFGLIFGIYKYIEFSIIKNIPASTGTVVIPSMLIILGTQLLISFVQYDINSNPKIALNHERKKNHLIQDRKSA